MLTRDTILQNRYRIVRVVGQGGMGAVYEAQDRRLGSTVAVKETFCTDPRLRQAFEHEARLLAQLHHPALPSVSDHFIDGEGQFLVMQFIPGEDLGTRLLRQQHPFAPTMVLAWADQLLAALEYLHGHHPPVVHRDIKPQNLKLTAQGTIVLLDFGLAKGAPSQLSQYSLDQQSLFGYTPFYAPLEQMQGSGTDPRSDVYALGATLYCLLTNTAPADALTRAMARVNQKPEPLRPATACNPQVSPYVAAILQEAMALDRAARPTATALRQMLRDAVAALQAPTVPPARPLASVDTRPRSPISSQPVTPPLAQPAGCAARMPPVDHVPPPGRGPAADSAARGWPRRRPRLPFVLAGGLAALMAVGLWTWSVHGQDSVPPEVVAPPAATPTVVAPTHYQAGLTKMQSEDWQGAIDSFTQALRREPSNASAYNYRGESRAALDDDQGALAEYDQAIRLNPNYARAYVNRGVIRARRGDTQNAVADYDQAIQLNPNYARAYLSRGLSRSALGDNQGAVADYDQAIRLNANYTRAYMNRGVSRARLGDNQGAVTDYDHAIRLDPNDALAYMNRGVSRAKLGDNRGARADYNQAANLYQAKGETARAKRASDAAARLPAQ